jgi:CIC family chloride channel protein
MMAMFGGIAHAPLAVMLMVAEMTGNLSLLAPAMVAVALATALVGDRTIYTSQLPTRADSPAHRIRFGFPLLSSLLVRDAMRPLSPGAAINGAPVVQPGDPLDATLELLTERGASEATVVESGAPIGRVTVRDVVTTYKTAMGQGTRRVGSLSPSATLIESRVPAASPLAGCTLRDLRFPPNALVVAIAREGEALFPRAATRLAAGDVLTVLVDPGSEQTLRAFLGAHNDVEPNGSMDSAKGDRS